MCGTTHACFAALQGNFWQALTMNPIFWLWLFWSLIVYADLWHRVVQTQNTCGEKLLRMAMENNWIKGFHVIVIIASIVYKNQ
jgi:hypothetical protein